MENKRKDNAPCPARKPADSHTAADKPGPELSGFIERAVAGDKESLETVISSVRDLVFNLSLRMLGTFPDAEDATQDILLKISPIYLPSGRKAHFPHGYSALQ